MEFRTLRADEIDCRLSQVWKDRVRLLLYKDARCDMTILDETVGPLHWKREHSRGNANCTVSIWDTETAQWVSKEDTGTESYTEKEKGLASDSFKRACVNWGIGRELYTAPDILIWAPKCTIKDTGRKDARGNPVYTCYDSFSVKSIGYDIKRTIKELVVVNRKTGADVFRFGVDETPQQCVGHTTSMPSQRPEEKPVETPEQRKVLPPPDTVTSSDLLRIAAKRKTIESECLKNGWHAKEISAMCGYDWETMTEHELEQMLAAIEKKWGTRKAV